MNGNHKTPVTMTEQIHRHGERAPLIPFSFDPHEEAPSWPEGLGALLQKGKETMYELGRFLRHRYDGFVSSTYKAREISMVSAEIDRCIMSAQLVLAGLYPPVGIQVWNPDIPWQPIPVHTIPTSCDDILRVYKKCILLSKERKKRIERVIRHIFKYYETFLKGLSQKVGQEIVDYAGMYAIQDNLQAMETLQLPLPDWADEIVREKLNSIVGSFFTEFRTPTMIKLESGVFINEILSNMKQKANDSSTFERRMNVYSASDRVMLNLWQGMNITKRISGVPPCGAALIIELHEIDSEYRVKILYKNGDLNENLEVLKIGSCQRTPVSSKDEMCDLKEISEALEPAIITDFDGACENSK
ncbi:unnamed protein product, partial [Bemisia tabaci]